MSYLNKISDKITDLRKQERAILADESAGAQGAYKVREIREQINDLARNAEKEAQAYADEYAKTYVPEISHLSEKKQNNARALYQNGVAYRDYLNIQETADIDGNNSVSQEEFVTTTNDSPLTMAQRAYMFALEYPTTKTNPYEVAQELDIQSDTFTAYYNAVKDIESSKFPNGKTVFQAA